ncbi:MAG: hypothetical protein IKE30_04735 [Clostridia bacterium]|nr:hypothetical protein [Clostridia bacterium]
MKSEDLDGTQATKTPNTDNVPKHQNLIRLAPTVQSTFPIGEGMSGIGMLFRLMIGSLFPEENPGAPRFAWGAATTDSECCTDR